MDKKSRGSAKGLREHLPLAPRREEYFRWRGNEISRVEGFTDAVFAFAVTLLVVALEVPHTFEGLMDVLRGFPAFVLCFTLLMTFWNAHYRYHRRYGIDSLFSRVLTMAIIVVVLFYVYPLKFMATLITVQLFGLDMTNAPHLDGRHQVQTLYLIYGSGLAGVWGFYAALYGHALAIREKLQLDAVEVALTRAALRSNFIYVAVCCLSIVLALLTTSGWLPGVIYFLLGPLHTINEMMSAKLARALATASA